MEFSKQTKMFRGGSEQLCQMYRKANTMRPKEPVLVPATQRPR